MLTIAQLETVYDTLAEALDEAGPAQRELFLVKPWATMPPFRR